MGKKGSKRKTRWRTLSIGAPPGEEDEEDGLRNGFTKGQENDTSTHSFSRSGQGGYKPRWTGGGDGGLARHKDESSGSPSQPKIIFNEDEYTRITTPRQDMLFKKGYLSKKKPWSGNANTSATSSTTESQSASHSTADGSETTEDQQLLDRDCGTGEYPARMDTDAQLSYGTFYDHVGGYYYEYPVMLVGPAPMPAQVAPSVLAAVPCGSVPLRPIEWINPIFVPKIHGQQYCVMDYEASQGAEGAVVMEEHDGTALPTDNANGTCNESGTGSGSCNGSVAGETEEQPTVEADNATDEMPTVEPTEEATVIVEATEEPYGEEQQVEEHAVESGVNGDPYYEPMLMEQPVHVSHVIPAVPQPYMYPGHYMFGPPLINVNGVTMQAGPMIRTTDVAAMSAAYAQRRKKKKRRKPRRLATGNTEDEEEGEYSSECDTGLPPPWLSWKACSTSATTTTTASNRPLNPECQEFQLRQVVKSDASLPSIPSNSVSTPTFDQSSTPNQSSAISSDATSVDNETNEPCNGTVSRDSMNQSDEHIADSTPDEQLACNLAEKTPALVENGQSTSPDATDRDNEANRLNNCLPENEDPVTSTNDAVHKVDKLPSTTKPATNESSSANDLRPSKKMHGERSLVNGKLDSDSKNEDTSAKVTKSRPSSPAITNEDKSRSRSITPKNTENVAIRDDQNHESLLNNKSSSSNNLTKRKYSAKGSKFVREPTPGPDLDDATETENETKLPDLTQNVEKVTVSNNSKPDSVLEKLNDDSTKTREEEQDQQVSNHKFVLDKSMGNHLSKEEAIEASNEDSGFESQTRLSDYPITEAVTEWLRREKSPDLFITSAVSMDCEEDEDDMDEEPPKNLQGNPMPALSANNVADNSLSRVASCGEFARINNVKCVQQEQQGEGGNGSSGASRKKKDAKRRTEERRRVARHAVDGKLDHEVVSSSDSCGQQEELMNNSRRKNNPIRQQQNVVGDVCELTEKDSVAGMRVASSSRVDSKRVNARRTKKQGRTHVRDSVNNAEARIKRIEDVDDEDNDEGIVEDNTMNVRTFEKGEIVVSEEGKLLTTSVLDPSLRNPHGASTINKGNAKNETGEQMIEKIIEESKRSSSDEDEESGSGIGSLDSIEEPDVLECWEAEIIEPVITPKRMLQSEGVLFEGEAAEDDTMEVEQINMEYVQKYYRLARDSVTSVEEEINLKAGPSTSLKLVPNKSVQEMDVPTPKKLPGEKSNIPIDEAFEVYESCYTGNSPFLSIDPKVFKSRTLYGQEGETPIPCKAACCHIQ